ncbi:unnamed protein product [Gongylonema pulchrum]|uniref:Uncharacterized protein n=1 Tax=Gongylonema pulchrum TaxID=637853 RepID=A0A183DAV1_9BILA|nr:unnamed protein product [Gongylonema pulchrum]
MTGLWSSFFVVLGLVTLTLLYNEYLIYYVVIYGMCSWPVLAPARHRLTKVLLLTDTHLLGPYRGHWFDKLRRFSSFQM